MNRLEKIEALEKELAELKASLKEPEFEYPIFKRNKETGLVVKFTGLREGEVVFPDAIWFIGHTSIAWIEHTNERWKDVAYDKERGLLDGQLVWAWDSGWECNREVRFFDALNKATFSKIGNRNCFSYQNFKAFEGEWPEWAIKAYKELKFKDIEE